MNDPVNASGTESVAISSRHHGTRGFEMLWVVFVRPNADLVSIGRPKKKRH